MNLETAKSTIINLINENRLKEAEEFLIEQEQLFFSLPEKYTFRGVIEYSKGNVELALIYFLRGVQLYENDFFLNYNLAYVSEQLSELEISRKYYAKSISLNIDEETKKELKNKLHNFKQEFITKSESPSKIFVFLRKNNYDYLYYTLNTILSYYGFQLHFVQNAQLLNFEAFKQLSDNSPFIISEFINDSIVKLSEYLATKKKSLLILVSSENVSEIANELNKLVSDFVLLLISQSYTEAISTFQLKYDLIIVPSIILPEEFMLNTKKDEKKIAVFYDPESVSSVLNAIEIIYLLSDLDKEFKFYLSGYPRNSVLSITMGAALNNLINSVKLFIRDISFSEINSWLDDKGLVISTKNLQKGYEHIYATLSKGIKPLIMIYKTEKYPEYLKKFAFTKNNELIKILTEEKVSQIEYRKIVQEQLVVDTKYISELRSKIKSLL